MEASGGNGPDDKDERQGDAPLWAAPEGAQPPPPPSQGPQSPQSPAPGPQSPAPAPQAPQQQGGPPPPPMAGPQSPVGAPPPSSGYGGPVPPGGWQQPAAAAPMSVPGELASWWSRVGAALLDGLILTVSVVVLVLAIVAAFAVNDILGIVVAVLFGLAAIVVYVLYGAYFMARDGERNGQTPGKQIVGIRVIRDNGQPFDFGQGILREFVVKIILFGWVGGFFFSIPTLLDVLWPLWDDTDRALHDMIVSSHVVKA